MSFSIFRIKGCGRGRGYEWLWELVWKGVLRLVDHKVVLHWLYAL